MEVHLETYVLETRFRSQFRIVPKAFILFGKDKDVYKKDEDV